MIRLGEKPFLSVQGEGNRTGVLSVWVRWFGCNLTCSGFGQLNPMAPETWVLPYKTIDISKITTMEELPVLAHGCDSGYSWAPRFKKLAETYDSPTALASVIESLLPNGVWRYETSRNEIDLCFTGGEPLMNQKNIIKVMNSLQTLPEVIQVETNGTQALTNELKNWFQSEHPRLHFNISPKLENVSGEKSEVAWNPLNIKSMTELADGCLKFVMNDRQQAWEELHRKVDELRLLRVGYPIYIMPVGATKEDQENIDHVGSIAKKAIAYGYHVSGRLHATLFGNGIGT